MGGGEFAIFYQRALKLVDEIGTKILAVSARNIFVKPVTTVSTARYVSKSIKICP